MPTVRTVHDVGEAELDGLRRARTDLLKERQVGPDRWEQEVGPFGSYTRSLKVGQSPAGQGPGRTTVTEQTDFRLAVRVWSPLLWPLMKRALRSTDRSTRRRWWWPTEVVSEQSATLISLLTVLSIVAAYLGVVISQTISFASAQFGSEDSAQANTLAAVRIGVLLSFLIVPRADRLGRRPMIVGLAVAAIGFTVLGSLAPSLLVLGVTQAIARGLTTGLLTLLFLAATEEVPASARAFTISIMTMCAALGAGMVVWVLPLADVGPGGWRVVYVVPLLFLPVVWWVGRLLPETRRFVATQAQTTASPIDWRRFAAIGAISFLIAIFASPASQLRNEFLNDDLGYDAAAVSLFQLVISAPAGTAIFISGIMADRIGRRLIGSIGVGLGAIMVAVSYQFTGVGLWIAASAGIVLTGAAVPALRGYSTELFPTRSRARVGGMLDVVAVAGSAFGLVTVGYLAGRWDDLGLAISAMVFGPLIAAVLVVILLPETARVELEVFNPGDPILDPEAQGQSETESETETETSARVPKAGQP